MRIHKVEFKNFASYGNRSQIIEFDREKSDLYLVLGGNGAGKSTLAKVITYLCYGRVEGAHLRDLPNRVNKNLWGKIWLESKGNQIEIERGIAPGVFNVLINGTTYDVAGKANLQEFLETEIYEIPYHVFKNVIILSVNDFKSFITMSPYDKKQIIDRIFGFSVINEMRELVKSKRKLIIEEIRTFSDEIRTLEESIESVLEKIEQYKLANKKKDASKIDALKKKLIELNEGRKKLKEANEKTKEKITECDTEYRTKSSEETRIKSEINSVNKGLKLYENNNCPTCSAPLDSDFHKDIKEEKEETLRQLNFEYENIQAEVLEIDKKLIAFRDQGRQIHVRVGELETKMTGLKDELISLAEKSTDESSSHLKDLIKEFKTKKTKKDKDKLKSEGEDYY